MFKSLSNKGFTKFAGLAAAVIITGCGSSNNNSVVNPYNGQGGAYGYGTSCFSAYSSSISTGFSAPQVSLSTTSLHIDGQASGGGGYNQGQFTKQFYAGTLYVNLTGLPQYSGQPSGPLQASGSINVSGSLVDTWKYQLGLNFGWGSSYGYNQQYNQQYQQGPCVQRVVMNLVVNPTLINPQIYSGVVQFQLSTGQTLPPFLI